MIWTIVILIAIWVLLVSLLCYTHSKRHKSAIFFLAVAVVYTQIAVQLFGILFL